MKIELDFLRSRVARRVFGLFVISSLLPIAMLGLLSFEHVQGQLSEQSYRQLHRDSKAIGMTIVDRLSILETELELIAERLQRETPTRFRGHTDSDLLSGPSSGFVQLTIRTRETEFGLPVYVDSRTPLRLTESEETHLSAGKSLLATKFDASRDRVFLIVAIDPSELGRGILIGEVDQKFLWDIPLGAESTFCVLNELNKAIHCSDALADAVLDKVASAVARGASGRLEWDQGGERILGNFWSVFFKHAFHASNWTVLLGEPEAIALSAMSRFKAIFPPVIVMSVLVIVLLSMSQIRRFMVPLEKLSEGTRKIADKDFSTRVNIDSGDEFEELATSFNSMTKRLGRQFNTLATMAEIDRLILSTTDPDYIVETLLRRTRDVIPCDVLSVAVIDRADSSFARLLIDWGDHEHQTSSETVELDSAELDALVKCSGHLLIDTAHPSYLTPMLGAGIKHFLVLPVVLKEGLSALMSLGWRAPDAISQEDVNQARELADRAAVALSNAAWEEKLYHQAHYDALTDLPNRALLKDRLEQALSRANRNGTFVALLFLDLDRFKGVNDSLGHGAGDLLLQETAKRLTCEIREVDTVVRFGGDEFIVVIPDLADDGRLMPHISKICEGILAATLKPHVLQGHQVNVTSSIGISLYPTDADNFDDLLKNADTAMYHAKAQGRDNYQFYANDLNAAAMRQLDMENDLRAALDNDEFELFYQPQVHLESGRLIGAESLLRWNHPRLGLVSPVEFIPLAEESGLITSLGEWVLRTACAQSSNWLANGLPPVRIAVNLSARQFRDRDLVLTVKQALDESRLPAELLELEVTEGTIMGDIDRTIATLKALSQVGVRLAIDDFGTGYSSLAYLAQFPLDVLKIDKSFVTDVTNQPEVACIVSTIVSLAHSLNLSVIAEGVETVQQLDAMRSLRCEEIQGYLFGKPVCAREFERLLAEWQPRSESGCDKGREGFLHGGVQAPSLGTAVEHV